jgi:hypothetical protein
MFSMIDTKGELLGEVLRGRLMQILKGVLLKVLARNRNLSKLETSPKFIARS